MQRACAHVEGVSDVAVARDEFVWLAARGYYRPSGMEAVVEIHEEARVLAAEAALDFYADGHRYEYVANGDVEGSASLDYEGSYYSGDPNLQGVLEDKGALARRALGRE